MLASFIYELVGEQIFDFIAPLFVIYSPHVKFRCLPEDSFGADKFYLMLIDSAVGMYMFAKRISCLFFGC